MQKFPSTLRRPIDCCVRIHQENSQLIIITIIVIIIIIGNKNENIKLLKNQL